MTHKQNLHIHSTYADGKDRPEDMVQMAILLLLKKESFRSPFYWP